MTFFFNVNSDFQRSSSSTVSTNHITDMVHKKHGLLSRSDYIIQHDIGVLGGIDTEIKVMVYCSVFIDI